ncbi:MAG: N-acetylmuramoyl-L-alanine amidase-like domain-containing protein [Bacteroidota bacterium]
MNRRTFIVSSAFTAASAVLPFAPSHLFGALMQEQSLTDEQLCKQKFDFALAQSLAGRPINEVIVEIGKTFLGIDYGANLLDTEGEEKLVVNLRALDCVTFYENCVTLARCIKMKKTTFNDYLAQLQFLRYRNGKIDGYPSRLHYTTDYWHNAEEKGILKVVTSEIFGENNVKEFPKPINFMSTHRDSYKHLKINDVNWKSIKAQEDAINSRKEYFLPKGNLHMFADKVNHGDLIGIVTNIAGLDISHTGIAVRIDGKLRYMHAPNVGKKVQITEGTLHEYLALNSRQTGIIVARVSEVE